MSDQLTMHAALGTDGSELLSIDGDRKANRCTASCLDARTELRGAILGALAERQGTRRVAEAYGVSREVVRALKRQALASGELDQVKQSLGREAFAMAAETLDRISDEIEVMPRASLPIVYGVLIDKAQLLTGGPTARIQRDEAPANINDLVAALPSAEVVELVDSRETSPAKAADLVLAPTASAPAGDSESPVSLPITEGAPADRTEHGQTAPKKDAA